METIPKKILVIDDDPLLLQLVGTILKRGNYEIHLADGGLEGIRLFNEVKPDLIILDIMMPDLDGWEVCKRIREVSTIPILMMSARGTGTDIQRARETGATDYLIKPVYPNELLTRISAVLNS